MLLYDPALTMRFRDYGIMLPISPERPERVLEFLSGRFYPGARGKTMPYPGPVFTIAGALNYLGEDPSGDNSPGGENSPGGDNSPGGEHFSGLPPLVSRKDLERVHRKDFIAALFGEGGPAQAEPEGSLSALEKALLHAYELIDSQGRPHRYEPEQAKRPLGDLFRLVLDQTGGTYLACRLALAPGPGFCYYLGGGMHHARYDAGSGFCLINDVAVAAVKILSDVPARPDKAVRLIWIVDLDAHKGDGTAELIRFARERGELAGPGAAGTLPRILTLSVHMARGWPLDEESLSSAQKGRAPLLSSDIDIAIDSGEEGEYTPRLAAGLGELEKMSGAKPDLILVVDGADPYEHDGLPSSGLLRLTLEQCLARDNLVYRYAADRNIPSAWIQAGGYGERAWEPAAYFLRGIR